ncbi:hypothetical protein IEQ34_001361 [Dendrobium chrysotoxum]|uniref:Disease resistance N-terminal domain-containing protein n=1 Tax=Dendrobium chrysotoxum TaxID=161865 RepID=A0AAV7HQJ8_DENCH|nr:hypothetical protein IEQ34_001361 [Dendrobium chrysotoxum]
MEKLQELYFHDIHKESLPECLLLFLRQRGLQNDTNDDFQLSILCNEMVLRECLKEGSYWDLIQHIPRIRFSDLLADFVKEKVIMQLGVKDELHTLGRRMRRIQCLLNDAEKKKFDDSSTELWLSELKDVMYDAEDIIDLCRIEGTQLLADQNPESRTSSVRCDFSSAFSCFTSVPLRHEIGNRIKDINERLKQIYEDRERFKLEKSMISKTHKLL